LHFRPWRKLTPPTSHSANFFPIVGGVNLAIASVPKLSMPPPEPVREIFPVVKNSSQPKKHEKYQGGH
jgi:hypothetical protein